MDETEKAQALKKFYGHDRLKSKYTPTLPMSVEREYIRLVNQYMRLLKDELESEIPKLRETYKKELADDENTRLYHSDSATGLFLVVEKMFQNIANNLEKRISQFGLVEKLEKLANLERKLSIKEWKKVVKATLGLNLAEDYYKGDMFRELMRMWTKNNVELIKTIPLDTLGKMKEIVYDGYDTGMLTKDIVKAIRNEYGISKAHATLIARDQCAKLNGDIMKAQQTDAGITHYIWSASNDERVRDCHRELDGQMFSWDNPPEMWYETKKYGRVYTGRFCHPAQDYQCRCVARPVFTREINIPTEKGEESEKQ